MNRPFVHRGRPVAGVYQRCRDDCPGECSQHTWSYSIELPAGPSGKRRQVTKGGFPTGKKAMEARADVAKAHRDGDLPAGGNLTVEAWLTKWLTLPEVTDLRPNTITGYRDHVRCYLIPHLGRLKLSELRSTHVVDMISKVRADRDAAHKAAMDKNAKYVQEAEAVNAKRRAAGKKRMMAPKHAAVPRPFGPASAQRLRATLRAALGSAMAHSEVARNVAAGKAVKIRGGERPRIRIWEPEHLREFLAAVADDRMYAMFYLAAFAGLRRGELCGLSWDDVDLDNERLVVRMQNTSVSYQVVRGRPKTRESEDAVVDLDSGTVAVLRAWRRQQSEDRLAWGPAWSNPDNLVFTRENGAGWHPDFVTKRFARLVRNAGLPQTRLHDLRHLSGSLQLAAGVDIAIVSKRLRHSTIKLTADTYSHLIGTVGKRAAEASHALVFGESA